MSTSGSANYNLTRDEIITTALELIGKVSAGDSTDSNDVTLMNKLLNIMIKAWQAQGIHLWSSQEAVVFLVPNKHTYSLATSNGDKGGNNPISTLLTADASGTSLTVTSTIGMTATDNISIELDDGTRHYTTIVSVDSATGVTITSALASAAASGNTVYSYTSNLGRPLYITSARFRNESLIDRVIKIDGRREFMNMANKSTPGKVNRIYYSPQLTDGKLYVWQMPDSASDTIMISYVRTLEDFDASGDNPDLPQEWLEPIIYGLAVRGASAFGINVEKDFPQLVVLSERLLTEAQLWDAEEGSLRVVPNYRWE